MKPNRGEAPVRSRFAGMSYEELEADIARARGELRATAREFAKRPGDFKWHLEFAAYGLAWAIDERLRRAANVEAGGHRPGEPPE